MLPGQGSSAAPVPTGSAQVAHVMPAADAMSGPSSAPPPLGGPGSIQGRGTASPDFQQSPPHGRQLHDSGVVLRKGEPDADGSPRSTAGWSSQRSTAANGQPTHFRAAWLREAWPAPGCGTLRSWERSFAKRFSGHGGEGCEERCRCRDQEGTCGAERDGRAASLPSCGPRLCASAQEQVGVASDVTSGIDGAKRNVASGAVLEIINSIRNAIRVAAPRGGRSGVWWRTQRNGCRRTVGGRIFESTFVEGIFIKRGKHTNPNALAPAKTRPKP